MSDRAVTAHLLRRLTPPAEPEISLDPVAGLGRNATREQRQQARE